MYDVTFKYSTEYLRDMAREDLEAMVKEARQARLDIETARAQAFGRADKPHLFSKVRCDIARIETILRKPR